MKSAEELLKEIYDSNARAAREPHTTIEEWLAIHGEKIESELKCIGSCTYHLAKISFYDNERVFSREEADAVVGILKNLGYLARVSEDRWRYWLRVSLPE